MANEFLYPFAPTPDQIPSFVILVAKNPILHYHKLYQSQFLKGHHPFSSNEVHGLSL
jgi:hypothetical protein